MWLLGYMKFKGLCAHILALQEEAGHQYCICNYWLKMIPPEQDACPYFAMFWLWTHTAGESSDILIVRLYTLHSPTLNWPVPLLSLTTKWQKCSAVSNGTKAAWKQWFTRRGNFRKRQRDGLFHRLQYWKHNSFSSGIYLKRWNYWLRGRHIGSKNWNK